MSDTPPKPANLAHLSELKWAERELRHHQSEADRMKRWSEHHKVKAAGFAGLVERLRAEETI